MGLRHASQSRRRLDGRARLRGVPDRPHEGRIRTGRGRSFPDHDDPGDRRHAERRSSEGVERIKAMLPVAARAKRETRPASEIVLALQCGGSDGYSGITANPVAGRRRRHAGQTRRHRRAGGNAGNLRRRASADAARGQPRGRRKTGRAHPLVGGLHQAQWRRDEQQSVAGQQGRRAHHHSGKIAGRRGQRRHAPRCARSTNMPSR